MKKLFIFAIVALGMLACTDKNAPSNPNAQNGALSGTFSVSATKKVKFAQGNLQYQASTNTWRFAEHQYDIIGEDNANISETYEGWIDLFAWGTGNNPTYEDAVETFVDWGVNAISNGGNQPNLWRTLSCDEWKYLKNQRPNANYLMGLANVCSREGIVILPDEWQTPSNAHWSPTKMNFDINGYIENDWAIMESAGAIFLPCAGYRAGTKITIVPAWTNYWLSTPTEEGGAYCFSWDGLGIYNPSSDGRFRGLPVRLVQDVK